MKTEQLKYVLTALLFLAGNHSIASDSADEDQDLSRSVKREPEEAVVKPGAKKKTAHINQWGKILIQEGYAYDKKTKQCVYGEADLKNAIAAIGLEPSPKKIRLINNFVKELVIEDFPIKKLEHYIELVEALRLIPIDVDGSMQSVFYDYSEPLKCILLGRGTFHPGWALALVQAFISVPAVDRGQKIERLRDTAYVLNPMIQVEEYDQFHLDLPAIMQGLNALSSEVLCFLSQAIKHYRQNEDLLSLGLKNAESQKYFFPNSTHFAWMLDVIDYTHVLAMKTNSKKQTIPMKIDATADLLLAIDSIKL